MSKNQLKNSNKIKNEMLQLGVYALLVRGQDEDLLMGTNVNHFIKIPGLETLLHFFIADLDKYFNFIYENDIASYLNELEEKFSLDLISLQNNIVKNFSEMEDVSGTSDVMRYYLVITKTLEHFRKLIFKEEFNKIIKTKITKKGKASLKNVLNKINSIEKQEDRNISILYNLTFILYLSRIYKKKKITTFCEKLFDKIISELVN